jgi:acyl-CoA reductase-like NAD-dependent aldehyde dehydrogenase
MITSTSPQRPSDVVVTVEPASAADVHTSVGRARLAQREWHRGGPAARATALGQAADVVAAAAEELTTLIVREVGKPLAEARGEVARTESILRYYAQQVFDPMGTTHASAGDALTFTTRRPRGVAGLITPWNFPLAIPVWKAAPALAYGNAIVLKPAEPATACALRLAELLGTVLPQHLFTVLPGGAETGQALVDSVDVVSFTGSTAVGSVIVAAAAARGVAVQAEMGGQNPAIVLPDADLKVAAASIAAAAAGFAGQKCTATKRVIVVGDPAPFTEALIAAVEAMIVGDPADADVSVGPLIGAAARDRVLAATASARAAGGRVVTGGSTIEGAGWFVAPTVVDSLPADHLLECDEVFGPICAVSSVPSLAAAIERANSVRYGLVGGVYTTDLNAALAAAAQLDTGMVKINAPTTGVDFYLPFGGVKDSSYGSKEQGKAAVEIFTSSHTISIAPGS